LTSGATITATAIAVTPKAIRKSFAMFVPFSFACMALIETLSMPLARRVMVEQKRHAVS
jgi:hypothetical protein